MIHVRPQTLAHSQAEPKTGTKPLITAQATTQAQPLQQQLHPLISQLAQTLKIVWQQQLMLFPYEVPTELGYVQGNLEGEKLTIENTCYQSFQFRKLHLELAKVGQHLDILHCVMFPHPCFDLPIFGMDIVAAKGTITAAIVDLSPVSGDKSRAQPCHRTLPQPYHQALSQLPSYSFTHPRDLPEWGSIFSEFCLFIRPETEKEERAFLNQAIQYLALHCQLACEAEPLDNLELRSQILAGQKNYCQQQQKNDKTRRILERAFNKDWAQRYLETMLFDCAV